MAMNSSAASNNAVQQIPPAPEDHAAAWAVLEEGVDHIMTKWRTDVPYMHLFTVAYNYCTSQQMRGAVCLGCPRHCGSNAGTSRMCSELYNKLEQYFIAHLEGLKERSDFLQDEALLQYYAGEWGRYTTGANYINRLFTYLNRHWVKRERDEGRKAVYPVYTLTLVLWKANFLSPMQGNLVGAILRLVEHQRNGESIDQDLVKKVVDSFVSLGLDDTDINRASLDVYREYLEIPFLEATERYYEQESEAFLAENSVSDYLKKAEERLREEEDRVDRYLNAETRKQLISKCEHVLIRQHAEVMWESFQSLLDDDKDEDLQRMYALLSRIPEGLEPLREKFEEHVKKAGQAAVSKLAGEGTEGADGLAPKAYVNALLDVHLKNSETISRSFRGDAGFVASLDKACTEFVNATGPSTIKALEVIAKYANRFEQE